MIRTPLAALLPLVAVASAPADEVPRPEHPEPMAVRQHWANLNGTWQFRFDSEDEGRDAGWSRPDAKGFDRSIVVPFPWESELSGIGEVKSPDIGWYRRPFTIPDDFPEDQRVWLRFGAVDWHADVWVNGQKIAEHDGGYTPFEADITDAVRRDGENTLVVRAFDPTDPGLPTGKQVGWYTPTSGIWQTVWLEARPVQYIKSFAIVTKSLDPAVVGLRVEVVGVRKNHKYSLTARCEDEGFERKTVGRSGGDGSDMFEVDYTIANPKIWSPDSPHLYDLTLEFTGEGEVKDQVRTYFGLRTIARGRYGDEPFERILLNGKPIYLRGALDQSFNPQGIYTAPTDEFLKRDIELAKSFGTNFLRIHIKPDEPRRLYWADTLGMLIMEDMPNTWRQDPRAREAWEATMRAVVSRDQNHPAIVSWVDFNETWGLGSPSRYKQDQDTQQWVRSMVALTRQLDPTRLVEDNSPCNYDHVEGTDLNSWHFYIDDHEAAARHLAEVVDRSEPGSEFNYCPGQRMNTAPLINSEYGAVSAGGGDRDISWGFRDLTTLLRKYAKIQGYIYTELDDIEWEHNGFVDYDRTAKVFGYDAFVPGMTVADLQGADFVGYDSPPVIVAKPGEVIRVPLFVSHFSDREAPAKLRWWIVGHDETGREDRSAPRTREVEWTPYGVTALKPVAFKVGGPFVGALALTLEDDDGTRIAANFVNLVVRPDAPLPRVERLSDHSVAIRFAPDDYASARWTGPVGGPPGKVHGQGRGSFNYRLRLPEAVVKARPDAVRVLLEASSKAGREKVDWPERVNAQDYPQTDATTWPSTLEVVLGTATMARVALPDDPADARGVLSHLAHAEHGSHGALIDLQSPLPAPVLAELAAGRPVEVRLRVPDDADPAGGLAVFGAGMGRYPIDPTLILHTEAPLPEDLGVAPDASVAIDTAASRRMALLRAGDSNQGVPTEWWYTTDDPGPRWAEPGFDASSWRRGPAGFGTPDTPALQERTIWDTPRIWLRATVDLPELRPGDRLTVHLFHDEDVAILVNGEPLLRERGHVTSYRDIPLDASQVARFRAGANTLAVSCRQTGGGQGIDVGLTLIRDE